MKPTIFTVLAAAVCIWPTFASSQTQGCIDIKSAVPLDVRVDPEQVSKVGALCDFLHGAQRERLAYTYAEFAVDAKTGRPVESKVVAETKYCPDPQNPKYPTHWKCWLVVTVRDANGTSWHQTSPRQDMTIPGTPFVREYEGELSRKPLQRRDQ